MKKILNILAIAFSVILIQGCDFEQGLGNFAPDRVSFGSLDQIGVDVSSTATATVSIYATTVSGSDRSFNITADGTNAGAGSYTVPASVTIPGGTNVGTFDVTLSDSNLGIGTNRLVLTLESTTGLVGEPITISYVQNCTESNGTIDLAYDRWGSEVTWVIRDALNGVVASGGPYADTGAGTSNTQSINVSLCQGRSYTLTVTDSWGDGWGAGSSVTLTTGGVVRATSGATDTDLTDMSATSNAISKTIAFTTN